jgi:polyhydroxyalkanoate synthesis regulator phasin
MNKWKIAAAATAGLAIAGGGAALAAEKLSSPSDESQAVIDDAAQRLNVTPSALSDALKKALEDRVDAAVAAGRITKAEGDELKQRIESSDFPLFLGHPGYGEHHLFGGLDAAASYLGMTEDALRSELESGKTLAQVAREKGKSVDGLVQALYDDAKKHLDDAVRAGKLTQSEENTILSDVKQHIADLVNGVRPPFGRFGDGFRRHGDF